MVPIYAREPRCRCRSVPVSTGGADPFVGRFVGRSTIRFVHEEGPDQERALTMVIEWTRDVEADYSVPSLRLPWPPFGQPSGQPGRSANYWLSSSQRLHRHHRPEHPRPGRWWGTTTDTQENRREHLAPSRGPWLSADTRVDAPLVALRPAGWGRDWLPVGALGGRRRPAAGGPRGRHARAPEDRWRRSSAGTTESSLLLIVAGVCAARVARRTPIG